MVNNPGRRVKKLTYLQYDEMCQQLAILIKEKFPEINSIYGIQRGGSVLAIRLSHLLKLDYITNKDDIIPQFTIIVDDLSDSGETLINFCDYNIYRTATLFEREGTKFKPDISLSLITDEWIEFPYETKSEWFTKTLNGEK